MYILSIVLTFVAGWLLSEAINDGKLPYTKVDTKDDTRVKIKVSDKDIKEAKARIKVRMDKIKAKLKEREEKKEEAKG